MGNETIALRVFRSATGVISGTETMTEFFRSMASAFGRLFYKRQDDEFKARLLADLGLKN